MEHGIIEREIYVEATPEVVFEVVSRPEHIREWWSEDAELGEGVGATGRLTFRRDGDVKVAELSVVEATPPHRFAFRWIHPVGEVATETNSLLVTLDLVPSGTGTTVRLTETGFREQGWEVAVLEQTYADHVDGWAHFVPRLGAYAEEYAGRTAAGASA
jgi:uncharacterized protein YndB with AHSA1/START domain